MKICQQCGTQYPDDTLQFCLQDGTRLAAEITADAPTVVFDETETVVGRGDRINVPIAASGSGWQAQGTQVASSAPPKGGSPTLLIAAAAVVLFFLVLGILGSGGYWFYSRNQATNIGSNVPANADRPILASASPTPSVSPATNTDPISKKTPTPVNSNSVPLPPTVDDGQVRNTVTRRLGEWKDSLEANNFNGYMNNYADTVDYYKKGRVGVASIRADKARAFQAYPTMRVNISNVEVTNSGDTATVTFDKEWNFTGRGISAGKTRSQFEYRNINGRWLITGERDLKLYYKR